MATPVFRFDPVELPPEALVLRGEVRDFIKEARATARLNHANIVTVFQAGRDRGRVFIAMEYVEGGSLSDELKQEILEISCGEQPVEPQADLIVRKHLMGIIVLLFGLVALILLVSIVVIDLYAHAHS